MQPIAVTLVSIAAFTSALAACASPQQDARPSGSQPDASEDGPESSLDARDEDAPDTQQDVSSDDAPDSGVDDAGDGGPDSPDYCASDGAAAPQGDPCEPGQAEAGHCGRCGIRERLCSSAGVWNAWSACSELENAECGLCETAHAGCGYCGVRPRVCSPSGESCRWILGECDSPGVCSPGSFEVDSSGCPASQSRLRWCEPGCSWGPWADCSPEAPAWDEVAEGPLKPRAGFASVSWPGFWFVWGGRDPQGSALGDGASWDEAAGTWVPAAEASWPSSAPDAGLDSGTLSLFGGRSDAAVALADGEVVIWGGAGVASTDVRGDGATYNPQLQTWAPMSEFGAPSPRAGASAVWDPSRKEVIVWGGRSGSGSAANGGARYHVPSDAWVPMSQSPLQARVAHAAVWDPVRHQMIVWGGRSAGGIVRRDGAAYNPSTDSWAPIADAPIARAGHVAFWDAQGDRLIVLFGNDGIWPGLRGDGAAWRAASGAWSLLSDISISGYPIADGCSVVAGQDRVWVTGGDGYGMGDATAAGARYDPSTDAWAALPSLGQARSQHGSAFVGQLVVWGGRPASSGWVPSTERLRSMP